VDLYGGTSNKNLGDAFLLVWKFPESEVDIFDSEVNLIEGSPKVAITVEIAIISYIKIIAKINQYKHIIEYGKNKKL
jgi:class 3 adenylate cyclase